MFNFLKRLFSRKVADYHSFNVCFYVGDLPHDESDLLSDQFLDFVENLAFEANGATSYTAVSLCLSSDYKIKDTDITKIKEWLSIHNRQEFDITEPKTYYI